MPLFDPAAEIEPLPVVPAPAVTAPQASAPVYGSQRQPAPTSITDIEGEPWTVTWWGQLLASNESPRVLDLGIDATLQQYVQVTAFQLSVTDELSSSIESVTNTTVITGGGLIYPDTLIPIVGDMFIGRIEAGVQSVFTITSVERLSFYARSVYRVEYRLFSDARDEIVTNLNGKIAQERYFDLKRLTQGKAPLVSFDTANRETHYKQTIDSLMDRLYTGFFNAEVKTFTFTSDKGTVYDPWAVNFFNVVLGRACRQHREMPTEYTVGENTNPMEKPTLWRMLKKGNTEGLSYLYPRNFPYVYTSVLVTSDIYHGIDHVDVSVVPVPLSWNTVDVDPLQPAYVFSHAFYESRTTDLNTMEAAFMAIAEGRSIKNAILDTLITDLDTRTEGDLFYSLLLVTAYIKIKLGEG